jgi:hypothetical protein
VKIGHLLLSLDHRVEVRRGFLELVPATGVAEADDLTPIARQAVGTDRITRPGAVRVDAILEAKVVGDRL